ncbi:MAG: protein kinase [Pyrinomonadaceae bacterium]|nr:protein kinase [Pyrinomonadaceae bacterium]
MLTPETVLQSRYRVVRQLGQGGMGAVYEAVDERLDSTIALKETFFADERLRKQFEREARLLARMHHPALPRVSDHFAEGEGQFLVMHFIDGDDLAEMSAKRGGPFPPEQVLTWADQLLDALDYLHTQDPQIIHRDIKPQNLKLTPRGQIILLDFGLAKGQAGEISRVTTAASIFGYTPNYAPLEQIQGLGTDARSDIYALAATLYHLMTGAKPPDALTRAAAIVNGQPDPLKPAHEVNSSVPAGISAVLQKAMAQNRDQRYTSAAEMRKAFKGVGSEATVSNRTEANTVLFPAAAPAIAPQTRVNAQQVTLQSGEQATVQSGETTVVRKTGEAPWNHWVVTAAAVVLLVGGVGGFYAYQRRNNGSKSETPAINQISMPAVQSEPTGGQSPAPTGTPEQTGQVADDKRQVAAEEKVVRRQEKAIKQSVADKQQADRAAAEEANRSRAKGQPREHPEQPETPEVNVVEAPRPQQRPSRSPPGTVIRRFPDGTQWIIAPDGSRVVIAPDGSQHIVRPGPRNRRRIPPPP